MQNKKLGWLLALAGVVIIAVSLGADVLGLGAMPGIIGWKQWLGAAVGIALLSIGAWVAFRPVPVE